jgi:hypothetical protein
VPAEPDAERPAAAVRVGPLGLDHVKLDAPHLRQFGDFPKKSLLAQAPSRPIPAAVQNKAKTGFGIPVHTWLSGADGVEIGSTRSSQMQFIVSQWEHAATASCPRT